jgi:hypothetical protein
MRAARPVFVIRLRARPDVRDPARALAALLKITLRAYGFECVGCSQTEQPEPVEERQS